MRDVKYWNNLPAPAVMDPSVNIFQEKVGTSLDRGLSPLTRIMPLLAEPSSPQPPPSFRLLALTISFCYQIPCSTLLLFRPIVAYIYNYK